MTTNEISPIRVLLAVGLATLTLLPVGPLALAQLPLPTASAGPTAVSNLGAHLMSPQVQPSVSQIVAWVENTGAASLPASATVSLSGDHSDRITFNVPALGPGQTFYHNVTVNAHGGFTAVTLTVNPGSLDAEPADNTAKSWFFEVPAQPVTASEPVRLFAGSNEVDANRASAKPGANGLDITVSNPDSNPLVLAIDASWLESRVGLPLLQGMRFSMGQRDGARMYEIEIPSSKTTTASFAKGMTPGITLFGRGSPDTVVLSDRPMNIRVLTARSTQLLPTTYAANHTAALRLVHDDELAIDFDDGSHAGQPLWFADSWLRSMGLDRPAFGYDDGSGISSVRVGNYVLAEPPHFTVVHTFLSGGEPFDRVNLQPASEVYRDSSAQNIYLSSQRTDTSDESMVANFVAPSVFTTSAKVTVSQQGNWQGAQPFAIGNRADREGPNTADVFHSRKSIGFFYRSRDSIVPITDPNAYPQIDAYFSDETGTKNTVWTWTANENTGSPPPRSGFTVTLLIDVTATDVWFKIYDNSGNLDRSTSYPKSHVNMPFDIVNALSVGSESLNTDGAGEPTSILRVDDIKVTTVSGNAVTDEFPSNAANWALTGSAAWNGGTLQLTPNLPGQVGRAIHNTALTSPRFSLEFALYIDPNGADGLIVMFYKNTAYTAAAGGRLGFEDVDGTNNVGHEGWGIKFDGWSNTELGENYAGSFIALIKDTVTNVKVGTVYTFEDSRWHQVTIDVWDNRIQLYIDDSLVFGDDKFLWGSDQFGPRGPYTSWGFSGATGGVTATHRIDSVKLTTLASMPCRNSGDGDGDGLSACRERYLGTADAYFADNRNWDTDVDGVGSSKFTGIGSDYIESPFYGMTAPYLGARDRTFCGSVLCVYPDPLRKDLYVEQDWMVNGAQNSQPTSVQNQRVRDAYAAHSILYHWDDGTYGGANQVTYRAEVPFLPQAGVVDFYDYKNGGDGQTSQFNAADRFRIWHYQLHGWDWNVGTRSSGVAWWNDDDTFISTGHIKNCTQPGQTFCYNAVDQDTAIAGTILHELGHNLCLGRVGQDTPASCQFDGIDVDGPDTYDSVMNYDSQMRMVDYSSGANGAPPADFNDWGAIKVNCVSARTGDAPGAGAALGKGVGTI